MKLPHWAPILAGAVTLVLSSAGQAAVTVSVVEVGSDVVVTSTGTLNVSGLSSVGSLAGIIVGGTNHPYQSVYASSGFLGLGSDASLTGYSGLTGPSSFGSGGVVEASSSSGAGFIINGSVGVISPTIYISTVLVNGSPITQTSATETFLGQTFASLGLTPGQYVFTAPNDTVTLNIGPAAAVVPEPSTWLMMLLGFGGIGLAMSRRRLRALPQPV